MADFIGSAAKDVYSGTTGPDTISGGGGADTLRGGDGDDYIASGERDIYFGSFGFPSISLDTGSEKDTLVGGGGDDKLYAGYGDSVDGGAYQSYGNSLWISFLGSPSGITVDFREALITIGGGTIKNIHNLNWLQGSNFADTIYAEDRSFGYNTSGAVFGMAGNDKIFGGYYTNIVEGGDGDDTIDVLNCIYLDTLSGGNGRDTIIGPRNSNVDIHGDAGNDTIRVSDYRSSAYGDDGDDKLSLSDLADRGGALYGGAGNDTINGSLGGRLTADGGAGADRITGTAGDDVLGTGARPNTGGPLIYGDFGSEHDVVHAGGGDDTIVAGVGDEIDGGEGKDQLYLALGGLAEGSGKGITFALAKVLGADGNVLGGGKLTGIEKLIYVAATDFADSVRVAGSKLPQTLHMAGGNDVISSDGAAIKIMGGDGNDRYLASASGGAFDGGDGYDKADFAKSKAKVTVQMVKTIDAGVIGGVTKIANVEDISGSAFNDKITGNTAENLLKGMAGDDQLYGGSGHDTLDGGAGTDRLDGGRGDDLYIVGDAFDRIIESVDGGTDTVRCAISWKLAANVENLEFLGTGAADGTGNSAANRLTGNAGVNVLKGMGGRDLLDGGAGADRLDGGSGDDIYLFTRLSDHDGAEITDTGGSGKRDELRIASEQAGQFTVNAGEKGIERIVIGTGTGAVADRSGTAAINLDASALKTGAVIIGNGGANSLTGTGGADLIGGGLGGDTLSGGDGADTLFGANESDTLRGGGGADLIYGGEGVDTLTGGLGVDTFAIGTEPFDGVDQITDFTSGTDKLLVINSYLSGLLLAGGFRDGTSAQDSDDLAIYDRSNGRLYVDYDANGPQAQVLLARFTPGTNLAASDILLIDAGSWQGQTFAAEQQLLL